MAGARLLGTSPWRQCAAVILITGVRRSQRPRVDTVEGTCGMGGGMAMARKFRELSVQEVLALAISLEEEERPFSPEH